MPEIHQRPWLWAAPTGGVVILLLVAIFVGSILTVVMSAMKSSDAYKTAVHQAETNAQVVDTLGTPISEGWFITGNINVAGTSGYANLAIPLSGPKGKGTIYVVGNKSGGEWVYPKLDAKIDGGSRGVIDLRPSSW